MKRFRSSSSWVPDATMVSALIGMLIGGCATIPPERAAERARLEAAAGDCRVKFPFIVRYEVDSFGQLVYYFREDVRHQDREAFIDCVRDRLRAP